MIILDFHSKTPIYEQIEEQVMLMVRRGPLYRLFNIFCPVIFMCQRRVRQVQVIAQFMQ